MKKEFTIKFYSKKAGAHYENLMMEIFSGNDKKEVFSLARRELVKFANCDIARGLSEESEAYILEEIQSIKNGSDKYYHDQTTYSFKVFSKNSK